MQINLLCLDTYLLDFKSFEEWYKLEEKRWQANSKVCELQQIKQCIALCSSYIWRGQERRLSGISIFIFLFYA
mgnify:FL=1